MPQMRTYFLNAQNRVDPINAVPRGKKKSDEANAYKQCELPTNETLEKKPPINQKLMALIDLKLQLCNSINIYYLLK